MNRNDWELFIVSDLPQKTQWPFERQIKVISSGKVGPAGKRDLAARQAMGEILVFIDDDSFPSADFFDSLNNAFTSTDVAAVGGPGITPSHDGFWEKVSGSAFESQLVSSDPRRYRSLGAPVKVDDWPSVNLSVKRKVFEKVNGYSSAFWPGEDTEFCLKLKKNNFRINYDPKVIVYHHRRPGLASHVKQVGGYGLHRGFFARKYPENSRKLKYFVPSLFLVYLVTLFPALMIPYNRVVFIPFILYLSLLVLFVFETSRRRNLAIGFFGAFYVLMTHLSYGLNFILGFLFTRDLVSRLR
jgi:GT2 family glycosyltransferase